MKWKPKSIGLIITTLICSVYFNVLFCEDSYKHSMSDSKKNHHFQVSEMTLTTKENTKSNINIKGSTPSITQLKNKELTNTDRPLKKNVDLSYQKPKTKQNIHLEKLPSTKVVEKLPINVVKINKLKKSKESPDDSISNNQADNQALNSNIVQMSKQSQQISQLKTQASSLSSNYSIGTESALQKYMTQVHTFISQHKRYPHEAKIRKHQGKVTISFVINADGRVNKPKIVKSCKSRYINKSTKVLLSKLRFKAAPVEIKDQFPKTVILEVNYQFG